MNTDQKVIIVGGGIWGCNVALHLAWQGVRDVTVIERNPECANETTPRAAGLVGQLRSTAVMCRAIGYALDLFDSFKQRTGIDPGLRRNGSLFIALTEDRMKAYHEQLGHAVANGVETESIDHAEIQRLAPGLDINQIAGAYFVHGDGFLDPRRCALACAEAARNLGVTFRCSTEVTGLEVDGDRIGGVSTPDGRIAADQVVVTAGPWTGLIGQQAGYRLPMQTIRHQRVVTVPVDGIPDHHPVVRVTDKSCYIRPEAGGLLYGFFEPYPTSLALDQHPAGFRTDDLAAPIDVMDEARERLKEVYPVLGTLAIAERMQGVTTFSPDGLYVIGPVPGVKGLHLASGCAALGIAGSAAIGKWIAEYIATGEMPDDLATFCPQRFGERKEDPHWIHDKGLEIYGNYYALPPGIGSDDH